MIKDLDCFYKYITLHNNADLGGSVVSLTYMASEKVIPGYGGGMSSAKAALESDTRVLAFEAGRKYGVSSVFICRIRIHSPVYYIVVIGCISYCEL